MTLTDALTPFIGTYSPSFIGAMKFTLTWETEFQPGHADDYDYVRTENVPGDSGGLTRYGIDATDHPDVHIDGLTLADALAIYHGGEWTAVHGDQLPPDIAMVVFDAAVNVGTVHAAKWLQESVGLTGDDVDGKIGPQTIGAVNSATDLTAATMIDRYRTAYYENLASEHPRDEQFEKGWLARTDALTAVLA